MNGRVLEPSDFAFYPPLGRQLAEAHLSLLRMLPVPFAAVLLREIISYDWHFPAERAEVDFQLHFLSALRPTDLQELMSGFSAIPLSADLLQQPWARQPNEFLEKLTAYLWSTHEIDAYHHAALAYGARLDKERPTPNVQPARFCAVVLGRGARGSRHTLFTKLRPHGTFFTRVDAAGGWSALLSAAQHRAHAHPEPYAHWYVDGSTTNPVGELSSPLTAISYDSLAPLRAALLRKMHEQRSATGVGPEQLRSMLAEFQPGQLDTMHLAPDAVLRRFQVSLLTEGSGTQIFSTTFVQWAAREILRRARPKTLLLRYAPRQTDRPMNDLLLNASSSPTLDPEGSLIDADMGAFYTWINASRLSPASSLTFIAWNEEGTEAVAIAPGIPANTISTQPCDMEKILHWVA